MIKDMLNGFFRGFSIGILYLKHIIIKNINLK